VRGCTCAKGAWWHKQGATNLPAAQRNADAQPEHLVSDAKHTKGNKYAQECKAVNPESETAQCVCSSNILLTRALVLADNATNSKPTRQRATQPTHTQAPLSGVLGSGFRVQDHLHPAPTLLAHPSPKPQPLRRKKTRQLPRLCSACLDCPTHHNPVPRAALQATHSHA
jgi:hypothetical protein